LYTVRGDGPPLVLLHGGCDSDEHSFQNLFNVLSERHRIIHTDQVGQGRSPEIPGPLSYTSMMQDTAALLQQLRIKRVDVIGFSDGGILALMLALRHPCIVHRLVISGVNVSPEGLNAQSREDLLTSQTDPPKTIDDKLAR